MTNMGMAWLACAIDGEGSIFMMKHHNGSYKQTKRGFTWRIKVQVCNTNRAFCETAMKIARCGRIDTNRRKSERHKKVNYTWVVEGKNIGSILSTIKDCLIIKRELAELAILARTLIGEHINTAHNDKRLGLIYNKMKSLNKRGGDAI